MKRIFFNLIALIVLAGPVRASIIDVGQHDLQPNTSHQQITIQVTGNTQVQGVNLLLMMGDGGTIAGGIDGSAPTITDVSLIAPGTIFASNNNDHSIGTSAPQFWEIGTATASGVLTANGILAQVTIDTTGFGPGVYPLRAGQIFGVFNSDFGGIAADGITNGSITIVPEPATLLFMTGCIAGVVRRRR